MDVDGESIPEKVIINSTKAHSNNEQKRVELEELERIQFAIEHGAELVSLLLKNEVVLQQEVRAEDMGP